MNITDVREKTPEVKDMLQTIFDYQRKLAEKYTPIERKKGLYVPEIDQVDLNFCKDQEFLKGQAYRIVSEIVEATECLKNKPWKQSEVLTDIDHFKEEIADVLHFFVEFCIFCGIRAEELFSLYFKKKEVNKWRIGSNY